MSDKDSKDEEALTRMIVSDEIDNRLKDVLEDIAKLKEERDKLPSPEVLTSIPEIEKSADEEKEAMKGEIEDLNEKVRGLQS